LLASATFRLDWPVAGVEHGLGALGVGNELAVDQVADSGGDVLIVIHGGKYK
jgi:hypothetical protein